MHNVEHIIEDDISRTMLNQALRALDQLLIMWSVLSTGSYNDVLFM